MTKPKTSQENQLKQLQWTNSSCNKKTRGRVAKVDFSVGTNVHQELNKTAQKWMIQARQSPHPPQKTEEKTR